jgi:hypothetical protein
MSSAQILPAADLLDEPDEEVGSVMAEAGYGLEDSDILTPASTESRLVTPSLMRPSLWATLM